jgi:hypothetical protein
LEEKTIKTTLTKARIKAHRRKRRRRFPVAAPDVGLGEAGPELKI